MALLDAHSDELIAAAEQAPPPIQRTEPSKRFSAWGMFTAAPKGVAAGAAEATGSTADILGAFGQALATTGGSGKGMFATQTPEERKQTNEANEKLLKSGIDYNSEAGRSFRNVSAAYTPDAQTAHVAESAVFNLFRVGSKALTAAATMGNIPGAVVAGLEEGFTQSDQLGQQGVDLATRTKVGAVTAVTNAVGFALPAAGKTWLQTGGLALAGGPVSFIAQNAATREILQAADYSKLADQYDPLDPVGLALSTLLPLGFGALAMRGAKVKPGVEAKGPMPDGTPPPAPPKGGPPDDLVDAARVNLVREHMDATNPVPGDLSTADAHSKAYTQAMDQQAAGERVLVDDVAPNVEQSKAIAEPPVQDGYVRVYHGGLDIQDANSRFVMPGDRRYAEGYAAKSGDQGRVFYLDIPSNDARLVKAFDDSGASTKAPFNPFELRDSEAASMKQLPSNHIADWGAGLKKSLDDMAAEIEKYKPKPAPAISDTAQAATKTIADVELKTADGVQASPIETRINDIATRNPQALDVEMPTAFDADNKVTERMTVRDYLEKVKQEAVADDLDANLLEVAANCFLSGGL